MRRSDCLESNRYRGNGESVLTPFEAWQARHPVAAAELQAILTPETPSVSGSSEARVQSETRLAAVKYGALWRNNAGAYSDDTGRQIRYGLGNDSKKFWENWRSGDLVGITRIAVQPHHVGRTFGVFTMAEVKEAGWKKPKDARERAQMNCLRNVAMLGGIAGFVTGVSDYERYIGDYAK